MPPTDQSPAGRANDDAPRFRYDASMAERIEHKWQNYWDAHETFVTPNPGQSGFDSAKSKFYCLDMFPYPSGAGLHVGHPEGYTATDIISRFMRMKGHNVLHPMGWDAFGLPAEQYAIQTGIHPSVTTREAMNNFRRQLKRFGFSYDWSREFGTIDPEYYKWTQWIFLRMYNAWYDREATNAMGTRGRARPIEDLIAQLESGDLRIGLDGELVHVGIAASNPIVGGEPVGTMRWHELTGDEQRELIDAQRLVYLGETTVNWCPALGTVLANDEVIDGRSERGGHPVLRKPLKQWMFRITTYAERLLEDLKLIEWPESTKTMQTEWIGRSEGAEVEFEIVQGAPHKVAPLSKAVFVESPRTSEIWRTLDNAAHEDAGIYAPGFIAQDPYPPHAPAPRDLMVFVRNLPRLELPNATYFVTWRTSGGIVLAEDDRDRVLNAMKHWHGERCHLYVAAVMPDHVHLIIRPYDGVALGELVKSIKQFTSRRSTSRPEGQPHLWQDERFDHIIRDSVWLARFVRYVAENPVKEGLTSKPSEFRWSLMNRDIQVVRAGVAVDRGRADGEITVDGGGGGGGIKDDTALESGATFNELCVFTTRPDTIFGATYMVVAPEHELVAQVLASAGNSTDVAALRAYVAASKNKSDVDRMTDAKVKTGVFTGLHCINPATGAKIPVWTADYVLMGYGTGAIMAVPAHDERDWEFAKAFNLPIVPTYRRADEPDEPAGAMEECLSGEGVAINSANAEVSLNGLGVAEAKSKIIEWLERTGRGVRTINYRLRDWAFSRQRYWGEPFPIVYDRAGRHYPVGSSALPVELPPLADYSPIESDNPQPLLAKATAWINTTAGAAGVDPDVLPPETPVRREANTMPGSAGSSWYFLRYCDAKNAERFADRKAEEYWMRGGVDLYIGGSEHAVGHLLYSRFWQKVLFDLGEVSTPEPIRKLFHQGMITSFAYQRADKSLVPCDEVDEPTEGVFVERRTNAALTPIVAKMSKSLKNVVNPDDIISQFGADAFRLYEMYMGPLAASKPWNTKDAVGIFRLLQRIWRVAIDEQSGELRLIDAPKPEVERMLHRMIAKVDNDVPRLALNTAIASMFEFTNAATIAGGLTHDQLERFTLVLAPFAPHIAEELWSKLGHTASLAYAPFPVADPKMLVDETVEIAVQIAGKIRARIHVPTGADKETIEKAAMKDATVMAALVGKTVHKVVVVPGKLVNILAS